MTKRDLVTRISRDTGIAQDDVYAVVQMTLDRISEALAAGEHIEFRDFGTFDVRIHKARVGRNPKDPGRDIMVPERKIVKFKAGRKMKAMVGRP